MCADVPSAGLFRGTGGQYRWLTSTEHYMGDVVRLCPDAFLDHYLVVTAIDGGSPWLTESQRGAGWEIRSGIAHSQRISSVDELFYQRDGNDCPGFDEWYVFDAARLNLGERLLGNPFEEGNKPQPGRLLVYVGWLNFRLHEPRPADRAITDMFWQQLDWVRPDLYVADGNDNLTFVCENEALFDSVYQRLREEMNSKES